MKKIYLFSWCFVLLLSAVCVSPVLGQQQDQLAFPGAEGFGRFTSGGRGGIVYEVTNLNDSGEGSFRAGVEMSGARTIVFRVSGTIHLESDVSIRNGDLTIAGQTAPGEGIAFKGGGIVLNADNVIIRYIRVRPGDIAGRELDAIWGRENKDIIIDHCSMSWGTDEVGSFYDNENFTMQWCILSESLYESVHGKGRHGYGGIWGGKGGASFHHNLLAHHSSRNPRFNGARYTTTPETELVDFRNNVIFNWGGNSAYGGERGKHNIVANYYKAGPATPSGEKSYRILDASAPSTDELGRWYVADNYVEGFPEVTADNWNGGVQRLSAAEEEIARVNEPFFFAPVTTQTPLEAYESVLANAGASFPERDRVDARIATEVETGETTYGGAYGAGKGIIDTQETVGGWPDLLSAPAPEDTDSDGMPDAWEVEMGLDPNNAEDRNGDLDGDGYTNLEEYLNGLLESEPADFLPHPSQLTAGEVTTSSVDLRWVDNSDRETEIILERSIGDNKEYAELVRLDPDVTSFVDEGLDPGQVYYYRLQAISGEEVSAYSNPLAVITRDIPRAPDQEKLVAYWNFNSGSGTHVEDVSIHENDGELNGSAEWVAGKVNNAIDFGAAGSSGHVLVPHADEVDFPYTSFAFSLWMKVPANAGDAYLFHKGSFTKSISAGTSGKWYGLELKDDVLRFAVDDNNTKSEVSVDVSEFVGGEWVHVVAVRSTKQDVLSLYLNGDLVQTGKDATRGTIGQEESLILGNSNDLNTPFTGLLDEVKVFDYALNEAEVAGLYSGIPMQAYQPSPAQAEANVDPNDLVVSWSGDAPSYQLFMGLSPESLELVADDVTESSYTLSGLAESTEYFWRVDAVGENETVSGEVWSFTTGVPTGLAQQEVFKEFKFFPNPFSDWLTVEMELLKQERVVVSLYDVHNRLVLELEEVLLSPGVHRIKISNARLQNLPEGIYLCVLKTPEHTLVKRLMHLKK